MILTLSGCSEGISPPTLSVEECQKLDKKLSKFEDGITPGPLGDSKGFSGQQADTSELLELLAKVKNDLLKESDDGGCNDLPNQTPGSPNKSSNANSEVPKINFLDGTLEGSVQMNSIEACDFYFELQIENGTGKKIGFNFFQEQGKDWLFRLNAHGLNPMGASVISVTKPNGGIEPGRIGQILFKIMLWPQWVDEYNSLSILFKGKTIYETAVSLPNCD